MIKCLVIFMLLAIVTVANVDFIIHIPSITPLYFKTDSITTTYSGGTLSISDGVNILCYP